MAESVTISSPAGAKLLGELRATGCVLLVGSALSSAEPTNLPLGSELRNSVADGLAKRGQDAPVVAELFRRCAFEYLVGASPRQGTFGANLTGVMNHAAPNAYHRAIAQAIGQGAVKHVLTTNYDPNIEAACQQLLPPDRQPQVVVTEADASAIDLARAVIFKIHGCARRDAERGPKGLPTMVFSLEAEGELPRWKHELLDRLLHVGPLAASGYSGSDFELTPELASASHILWASRPGSSLSPNAARLLSITSSTVAIGSIAELLAGLAGDAVAEARRLGDGGEQVARDWAQALGKGIADFDMLRWRLDALVGIGAPRLALEGLGAIWPAGSDEDAGARRAMTVGRCYFHMGRYRAAARAYGRVVESEPARSWPDDLPGAVSTPSSLAFDAECGAIDAKRCFGSWIEAWRHIWRLDRALGPTDHDRRARLAMLRVLLLRHPYQITSALRLRPLKTALRNRARGYLRVVVSEAKRGRWHDLQQAELWGRFLDIEFGELYAGPLQPPPARLGFRMQGYIVAESMALREELRRSTAQVTEGEAADLLQLLDLAGAQAELWKLVAILARRRTSWRIWRRYLRAALRAWGRCEYRLPMRAFVSLLP